ncbi:MAG: ABC transporter substrate-binding protein [Burkholderiales bacterium]|jgi:iron complex transport system substrate-binding protein|nr:ABC transporter substrate-binding protein [Burkholderiales bacterium]
MVILRCLFIFLFLLSASTHAALTVTDSRGNTVTLETPAQRIITLSPHAAELVFAAGAGAQLIAVSEHSDAPPAVKTLPVIGRAGMLDIERIMALKPSLIVLPSYLSVAQQQTLRALRIALYIADAPTPEVIANDIEALGILSGHETAARAAAQRYRAQLKNITFRRESAEPLSVFYQIWEPPLYTVGGGSLIDQAITRCGGRNIFSTLAAPSPVVLREAVVNARPQVMIMGASEQDFTRWKNDWQRWPQIPAVRHQAFIRIDPDLLHRPGPRFVEGMAVLCEGIRDQGSGVPDPWQAQSF